MAKVAVLPGWGLGVEPVQPLIGLLQQEHDVSLHPLPALPLEQALQQLEQDIAPDSWLIGWSLGGMVATALAHKLGASCAGLITLGSNPCFVARDGWPLAMAPASFGIFCQQAKRNWHATFKGFRALCVQGESPEYQVELSLGADTEATKHLPCLPWLAELDNRAAIEHMACPQLHLLAQQDALVPSAVAESVQQLNPAVEVKVLNGSHALLVSRSQLVAQSMLGFIREQSAATRMDNNTHA